MYSRRHVSVAGLVAGAALAPALAFATPGSSAPVPVGVDHSIAPGDTRPRAETQVAVDPRDPHRVVVTAMQFNQPLASRVQTVQTQNDEIWASSDAGASFPAHASLPPLNPAQPLGNDPTLAWDPRPGGPVYASYSAFASTSQTSSPTEGLYVARSDDGGRSWRRSKLIEGFRSCGGPDRSQVAVDPVHGWVYVEWIHYVASDCGSTPDATKTVLRWARSTDGGRTFRPPVDFTAAGEANDGSLAVLPNGTVLTVHSVVGGAESAGTGCHFATHVVAARWTPAGHSLSRSEAVMGCATTAGLAVATYFPLPHAAVTADAVTGAVVVAIPTTGASGQGIAVGSSRDGGRTWTRALVTGTPGSQSSMDAVASMNGHTALGWLEILPSGLFRPVLAASADGGRTWSDAVPLATVPSVGSLRPGRPVDAYAIGHYLGVAVARDGTAYMTWPDLRPDGAATLDVDVFIRRVQLA